jgi:hypothetical protein
MGILSIKILDLIFRAMSVVTSDHSIPQPSNREFVHKQETLATLTQMLLLENADLTREVLRFVQSHLNNHFSLFKLKETGVIELLILCLSTKNGELALSLLQEF